MFLSRNLPGAGDRFRNFSVIYRGLLINGKLLLGLLHFDGDIQIGLIDRVVLPVSAEAAGDHLDAHHPVGNAAGFSLAIFMGLQFQTLLLFLAGFVQQMQDDFGIVDRLAIRFPDNGEADFSRGRGILGSVLLRKSSHGQEEEAEYESAERETHGSYSTLSPSMARGFETGIPC